MHHIKVFVESLDRFFPNVCELDLIFHYEEVNAILAEVIQGGLVLETNINEIVKQGEVESYKPSARCLKIHTADS